MSQVLETHKKMQYNLNGSNIFGTMENFFEPQLVNHGSRSGSEWWYFREVFLISYVIVVFRVYSLELPLEQTKILLYWPKYRPPCRNK